MSELRVVFPSVEENPSEWELPGVGDKKEKKIEKRKRKKQKKKIDNKCDDF